MKNLKKGQKVRLMRIQDHLLEDEIQTIQSHWKDGKPRYYLKNQSVCYSDEELIEAEKGQLISQILNDSIDSSNFIPNPDKITFEIDVSRDFDGLELELAIQEAGNSKAGKILKIIHRNWVTRMGHPEWIIK